MPSASSLSVRSKTTLPSTVVSASAPTDEHVCADRKRHTDPRGSVDVAPSPVPAIPRTVSERFPVSIPGMVGSFDGKTSWATRGLTSDAMPVTAEPILGARTIWELLAAACRGHADRTMLRDEHGRTLTFGELPIAVERCAAGLLRPRHPRRAPRSRGSCRRVSRRSCCRPRSSRLGAIQNPIIPIYGAREVGAMLDQAASEWLVVPGEWLGVDYAAMAEQLCAASPHGCTPFALDRPPR